MNMETINEYIGSNNDEIECLLEHKQKTLVTLSKKMVHSTLVSEINRIMRKDYRSCEQFGVNIRVGDICYIDFGEAYLTEAGFQHFGLIISITNYKAFVIPMTSNEITCSQAYDEKTNPCGKRHLMNIGYIAGMAKESVLFLNDAKYINSARVIDVKAYINPKKKLYKKICKRLIECIISSTVL